MERSLYRKLIARGLSLTAVLFGAVTIFAGSRVLAGSDPGYAVFLPLLIYNTVMGVAYIAAGIVTWFNFNRGKSVAALIFILNSLVLGAISYQYLNGISIAVDSVAAMIFRTLVWLMLYLGIAWVCSNKPRNE